MLDLQKTKLKRKDVVELKGFIIFKSRIENMLLNKESLKSTVLEFKSLSDRRCCLNLRGRFQTISLLNIDAS